MGCHMKPDQDRFNLTPSPTLQQQSSSECKTAPLRRKLRLVSSWPMPEGNVIRSSYNRGKQETHSFKPEAIH